MPERLMSQGFAGSSASGISMTQSGVRPTTGLRGTTPVATLCRPQAQQSCSPTSIPGLDHAAEGSFFRMNFRVAVIVAVLCVSGCSANSGTNSKTSSSAASLDFSGSVSSAPRSAGSGSVVDEARSGGADQEQLAILKKNLGAIGFADYERSVRLTVKCIESANIDVVNDEVTTSRGFPEILYSFAASSVGRSDDETLKLADGCANTHSHWVEMAYQLSPKNIEAREAQFAPYRNALLDCIRNNGGTVSDKASRDDLVVASSGVRDVTGKDCVAMVGAPQ
jgi:hypothetical protein